MGSRDNNSCPLVMAGPLELPCDISIILSPIIPSDPMLTLLSCFIKGLTSDFMIISTLTDESFIILILFTVPTLIPKNLILFPTCKPLTL